MPQVVVIGLIGLAARAVAIVIKKSKKKMGVKVICHNIYGLI